MATKTKQLKKILQSGGTEFILEAHNGLSAKIVEHAGFKGIWGSGLTISTTMGVRDSNEASWTQVLETVEFMSDATSIPILLDVDTGYGDFNNVRRLVQKLEQRDISGMCIEDKMFPKKNSLLPGVHQPLADINEYVGKIKAAKDTQRDSDFCVVARTEAFIAGKGLDEALERATIYADAGADAVVVHSKSKLADEVLSFLNTWQHDCPVVLIPTAYYDTPTRIFEELDVSLIIWANHLMRSCMSAMQVSAEKIYKAKSLVPVEPEIATVQEVFDLFDYDELKRAEQNYLPND